MRFTNNAPEERETIDDLTKLLLDMNELSMGQMVKNDYEPKIKIRGRKTKTSSNG